MFGAGSVHSGFSIRYLSAWPSMGHKYLGTPPKQVHFRVEICSPSSCTQQQDSLCAVHRTNKQGCTILSSLRPIKQRNVLNWKRSPYLVESVEAGIPQLLEKRVGIARTLSAKNGWLAEFDLAVLPALPWTQSPCENLNGVDRLSSTRTKA